MRGKHGNAITNQYYHHLDLNQSHYSIKSMQPHHRSLKSSSHAQSPFMQRIQKACTTHSLTDLQKEIALYKKEIQRLERQNLKKDSHGLQIKTSKTIIKQLEAELIETYRVICLYEGKVTSFEKELRKLEKAVASTHSPDGIQIEELLESYRIENALLMGGIAQKDRVIFEMEQKIKSLESKYFSSAWKLSAQRRELKDPLKNRFPQLRNTITTGEASLEEKQKIYKTVLQQINATKLQESIQLKHSQSEKYNRVNTFKAKIDPIQVVKTGIAAIQQINPTPNGSYSEYHLKRISSPISNHKVFDLQVEEPASERNIYYSPIKRYEINRKHEGEINGKHEGSSRVGVEMARVEDRTMKKAASTQERNYTGINTYDYENNPSPFYRSKMT